MYLTLKTYFLGCCLSTILKHNLLYVSALFDVFNNNVGPYRFTSINQTLRYYSVIFYGYS